LRVFKYFLKNFKKETIIVSILLLFGGFFEAVGVVAFLPLFQFLIDGAPDISHLPEGVQDFIIWSGVTTSVISISVLIAGMIGLKALFLLIAMHRVSLAVSDISDDLRRSLFSALLRANWKYFTSQPLGTNLNAIVTETFGASNAFISMARLTASIIQLSIYAIGAFLLSWQTSLFAIIAGGLLLFSMKALIQVSRRAGSKLTQYSKSMLTMMAELMQSIKSLRAMGLEEKFEKTLEDQTQNLHSAHRHELFASHSLVVLQEPLMVLVTLSWINISLYLGILSISELMVMGIIFIRLMMSLNHAQSQYQRTVTQEYALWSFMDTVKKTENALEIRPGKLPIPDQINLLAFRDVTFNYDEKTVLKKFSISFKKNQFNVIIGESGSGKSTIIDMICGLYQPLSGAIDVDGIDLNEIDIKSWRHGLGLVPQETFLFNDTIKENILVGRSGFTDDDIWAALDMAGASKFVKPLDKGLNQTVGENGRFLSGGQRQRIAIARAVIHKPQILLLDEATSALDSETEKRLMTTLVSLSKHMTVIFVSHNKTVRDYADSVFEIENGQVTSSKKSSPKSRRPINK
jgi:ATP-binding cassette subfamily C protein